MIANDSDRERKAVDRYYRSYAYAESDDLREWKNHRFILSMDADDPADTELYQFACHKIGQIYVGYMSVFYLRRRSRWIFISPPAATGSTSPASAGASRLSRRGRWDTTTTWRWPVPSPSRSSSTTRSTSITSAANFPHSVDVARCRSRHPQGRRGAGHVQARPVCLARNERSGSRAVPRGDQAVHRAALQAVPERGHLDEGIDPRGGIDARLATDSGLHRAAGPCRSRATPSTIRSGGTTTPT